MPIYTSEVKKGKLSHIALSSSTFNTTNFTELEQSSSRLSVGTENNNITVNGSTVNPFYFLRFFNHYAEPGGNVYSALLINRALQPGEEVTISGYFFRGYDPNTDNNNEAATPIAIVYETDAGNTSDFKTKPASDAYNIGSGGLTNADIVGQGIIPLSNGTNVGTLNNGWKYNTTGRSAVASTQARNIGNTGDQTDATLCPFNLSPEGSFGSRFYTITIRNDTSSEAFLKILGWDVTGSVNDASKYFSVHDLRVEFDNEIKSSVIETKGISGITGSPLTIRADKNINFKVDQDSDESGKFSFVNGSNTEIANIDESGNLQMDGDLTVSGGEVNGITVATNSLTFGNGATIVNTDASTLTVTEATTVLSGDLTVSGDFTNAASAATANKLVKRDGSGNFEANIITSAISGDVQGNATSADTVDVTNNTSNTTVYIPFVPASSTTAGQAIRVNDKIKFNPNHGTLTLEGNLHVEPSSTKKGNDGDIRPLQVVGTTTTNYVSVGAPYSQTLSGFSVGTGGESMKTRIAGDIFIGGGYDLTTNFADHDNNFYVSSSTADLAIWVRFFAAPIDGTPTNHTLTLPGGGNVSYNTDTSFDPIAGLPASTWTGSGNNPITISDHADFNFVDSNKLTVAFWIYIPDADWLTNVGHCVASKGTSNSNTEWTIYFDNDSNAGDPALWFIRDDESAGAQKGIAYENLGVGQANAWDIGSWVHVAIVDDSTAGVDDTIFYINGVAVADTTDNIFDYTSGTYTSSENLGGDLQIGGGYSFTYAAQGINDGAKLAEFAIWSDALTAGEVAAIYNQSQFGQGSIAYSNVAFVDGITYLPSTYPYTTPNKPNFTISSSGAVQRSTHTNSERILKTNIEQLNVGLESVCNLVPVLFNWKTAPDDKKIPGFIIDEVEDKFPELVVPAETDSDYKSLEYDRFCAYIVSAMKEIKDRLEVLESKI